MLDGVVDREEVTLAFRFVVRNVATTSAGFSSYLLEFTLKNVQVFLDHLLKIQHLAAFDGSEK